jgi:hypothetical protein
MSLQKYNQTKGKTLNWCKKLLDSGLMNEAEHDKCITNFPDNNKGEIPPAMEKSDNSVQYNYGLYNRESVANDALESGTGLNGQPSKCMIVIPDSGECLASTSEGVLYFISNSLDPDANELEAEWTLIPTAESQFALLSNYNQYLTIDTDRTLGALAQTIGPHSLWNTISDNDITYFESVQFPENYIGFSTSGNTANKSIISVQSKIKDSQWQIQSVPTGNSIDNVIKNFDISKYASTRKNIISNLKIKLFKVAQLRYKIQILQDIQTAIETNSNDILNRLISKLESESGKYRTVSNISQPTQATSETAGSNISDSDILRVKSEIVSARDYYINEINVLIRENETYIADVKTDLMKFAGQYDDFNTKLITEYNTLNMKVGNNDVILNRQIDAINKIDSEFYNMNKDKLETDKLKVVVDQNITFVKSVYNSNRLYGWIYKILLIVIVPIIIYLGFSGFKKYKEAFSSIA